MQLVSALAFALSTLPLQPAPAMTLSVLKSDACETGMQCVLVYDPMLAKPESPLIPIGGWRGVLTARPGCSLFSREYRLFKSDGPSGFFGTPISADPVWTLYIMGTPGGGRNVINLNVVNAALPILNSGNGIDWAIDIR